MFTLYYNFNEFIVRFVVFKSYFVDCGTPFYFSYNYYPNMAAIIGTCCGALEVHAFVPQN